MLAALEIDPAHSSRSSGIWPIVSAAEATARFDSRVLTAYSRISSSGSRGAGAWRVPRDDDAFFAPLDQLHRLLRQLGLGFVQLTSAMAWQASRETPNPRYLRVSHEMKVIRAMTKGRVRLALGGVQVGPEQQDAQLDGVIDRTFSDP